VRAIAQQKQRLPPQMRARVARNREGVDVAARRTALFEAGADRRGGESGAVLDAPEAFFLDSG
jgi:hypothetical protein